MNLRHKKRVPDPDPAPAIQKRTRGRALSLPSLTNGNENTQSNTQSKSSQVQVQGKNQRQSQSVVRARSKSVYENGNVNKNVNGSSTISTNGHTKTNMNGNYHHELVPYKNGNGNESDHDSFSDSDYECFEVPSMIRDAILSLNENGGSTLDSILNYIRKTYPQVSLDLFTPFLLGYLNDAVMTGKIRKKNKAYQMVKTKKRKRKSSEESFDDAEVVYDDDDNDDYENPITKVTFSKCTVVLKPLSPRLIVPVLLRNFCHTQNLFNYTASTQNGIGDDEDCWSLTQEFFESESETASKSLMENCRQFYIHLHDDRIIQADGPIHIQIQYHDRNDNQSQSQVEGKEVPKILRKKLKIVKAMIFKSLTHYSIAVALEVRDVNLFTLEIQDFLAFTQNSITHFTFGKKLYSDRLIRENVLLDFITKHLSHLKYLAICNDMIDSWDSDSGFKTDTVSRPLLLQLKTIRFIQNRRLQRNNQVFTDIFISEILQCAPNLEEIYGFPLKHLNLIEMSKKIKAVKSFSGFYEVGTSNKNQSQNEKNNNNNTDLYCDSIKILSRTNPKCELLDLRGMSKDWHKQQGSNSSIVGEEEESKIEMGTKILDIYINLLLQSSYTYLKKLKIRPLGAKLVNVRFPTLETLSDLQIVIECRGEDVQTEIFPAGWDLNRIFPNLSNMEIKFDWTGVKSSLDWKCSKNVNVVKLFPKMAACTVNNDDNGPPSIFLSVNHLLLTNSLMRIQLGRVANIFQNIQKLSIRSTSNLLKYRLPFIFSAWPKLKELNLEVDVACAHICMDSGFLGISEPNLKHLEREDYPDLTEEDERKYRIHSSICQLKDLEILRLSFYREGGIFRERKSMFLTMEKWSFFTPAVAIYGFCKEIMPNLNVRVRIDESCTSDDICGLLNMCNPLINLISIEM